MSNQKSIVDVALKDIVQKENSRVHYKEEDLTELMTSMRQSGLMQPIGLSLMENNKYELVFGNRRYAAAKRLGWKSIPSIFIEVDDDEDLLIRNTIENVQRADISPTEAGRICNILLKKGLTSSEIAARLGVEHKKVKNMIQAFQDIPMKFRDKIASLPNRGNAKKGKIPLSVALRLSDKIRGVSIGDEDKDKLFTYASQDEVTGDAVSRVTNMIRNGQSVEDAIKYSDQCRLCVVSITLKIKDIEKLQRKYAASITQILIAKLLKDPELNILGSRSVNQGKALLRKKKA